MPEVGGVEVTFADGKRVVDDAYLTPIRDVTGGHPERFPYADVMRRLGDWFAKDLIRRQAGSILSDHLRTFGL